MAGDWIKMRGNLWDDPRIAAIVDMTDSTEAQVIGALYWLWATADQHTDDGVLVGLSMRQIDRKTGVQGFASAVASIGWIVEEGNGIRICNFEDHNGETAKKRCQTAKRVAKHKAEKSTTCDTANADSVTPSLPREEKRREEVKASSTNVLLVAEGDAPPACPQEAIKALYHETLPELPRINVWSKQSQTNLKTRWRESARRQNLDWWRDFFVYVRGLPFLLGENDRGWQADLGWLVKASNFEKVCNAKFEPRR